MKIIIIFLLCILCLFGCKTVDFERINAEKGTVTTVRVETNEEPEKIIEPVITIVEKPVYYPEDKDDSTYRPPISETSGTVLPIKARGNYFESDYYEKFMYEIHCQPYRITDIQLEAGEEVLELPYISEPEVWQIGAGVSKVNGVDRQHFLIKPQYSKLTTSMVIITNKRVYHLLLKSFADYFMPIVSWRYPLTSFPFNLISSSKTQNNTANTIQPEHISFDYKIVMSIFDKTPSWMPTQVYDDGRKTYIVLNEQTVHREMPTIYNEKNTVINYRVNKNILIVDQLVFKMTLMLGKDKVSIEKKK